MGGESNSWLGCNVELPPMHLKGAPTLSTLGVRCFINSQHRLPVVYGYEPWSRPGQSGRGKKQTEDGTGWTGGESYWRVGGWNEWWMGEKDSNIHT